MVDLTGGRDLLDSSGMSNVMNTSLISMQNHLSPEMDVGGAAGTSSPCKCVVHGGQTSFLEHGFGVCSEFMGIVHLCMLIKKKVSDIRPNKKITEPV